MLEKIRDQVCLVAQNIALKDSEDRFGKRVWANKDGVYSTQVAFVPHNCIVTSCKIISLKSSGETLTVKIGSKIFINQRQITSTETSAEAMLTSTESIVSIEADTLAGGEYLLLLEFYLPTTRELDTK